jgi:2-polyprenyl-6-methoxyphenol hydroxylase-like FAD-dependent oxidoreductase
MRAIVDTELSEPVMSFDSTNPHNPHEVTPAADREAANRETANRETSGEEAAQVEQTTCCVVGGGPAGMMLALLLARRGVPVTLLESHRDFDRDFRGDTIHPSTLEVLDQIGLADRLLQIPHGEMRTMRIVTPDGAYTLGNFQALRTRFPYVAMLSQSLFLDFLAKEARQYPGFRLVLGANVQRLVTEDGEIRGARYRDADNRWHEVRAPLTVAADGRFSKLRALAGLTPIRTAPPMDVVWFRLPRRADDPRDTGAIYVHDGRLAVLLERPEEWQVGYVIVKGGFQELRAAGIEGLRQSMSELIPWLADRLSALQGWQQVSVLAVESSRLPRWHQPGLLLIGDAAHVMSPVGGVGINYAIQDAVEAANLLAGPLKDGRVTDGDLAAVQRRRELPVRAIQRMQSLMQRKIAAPALAGRPFKLPLPLRIALRLPILRNLPARMIAYGIRRVRVE